VKASIAHASLGFALAAALWSVNLLPGAWSSDPASALDRRNAERGSGGAQAALLHE
jgi:hypothetical protein